MNFDSFELFVKKYDMLPAGSKVLCAVSGGADSVCLLHLLHARKDISVVCAHFNHRLRREESDRDEAFVRRLCEGLKVECVAGSGDVAAYAAEQGLGTEEAARTLRYEFLFDAAEKCGANRIATAHNAEDNAETVLLNLARGAGLKGLCGIPPVRGVIVRPLLHTTRDEILEYLSQNGLAHVEDSTNSQDGYSRNRIRHHVLPVLKEQNEAAVMNIARAAELLREDENYLSAQAESFVMAKLGGKNSLPVPELLELPKPVEMRVFRLMCGPSLSSGHAKGLHMLCASGDVHASADVPGMRVSRELDRLVFGQSEPAPLPEREIVLDSVTEIPEAGVKIICEQIKNCGEINKSFNTFYFKSESICDRILLASRKDGAKVRLDGRGCTKSLKKLFREAGMTLTERLATPVLYDGMGVIAVYGFGVAERCRAVPGDNIIKIEVLLQDERGKNGERYTQGPHNRGRDKSQGQ